MNSRIIFVPLLEKGHTNALIGVLQRLQQQGHHLACYGLKRELIAQQFAKAGIECEWFPRGKGAGAAVASQRKTSQLRDPKRLLNWSALGIASNLAIGSVDELRAALKEFKPDVVCVDPMAYYGPVAAELEGIPWAAISPLMVAAADADWRCPWLDVQKELRPIILEKMKERGVSSVRLHVCDAVSPWLNTVFVTEAFVSRAWSGNRHSWFLGPSKPLGTRGDESDFPWSRLSRDRPIVYVSGGGGQSLSFEPETFLEICHSLSPSEAQFICAVHGLFEDSFIRRFPDSCVIVRDAPQLRLLESYASIAVIHGGINSVTECVSHARPMLVVPIGHEQPIQAMAVERRGIGLSIELSELTRENCRAALLCLLDPSQGFARSIQEVSRSYAVDGARQAAELIAELARSKKSLPPPLSETASV